jgi:superfamily II DNA or RNA helicase
LTENHFTLNFHDHRRIVTPRLNQTKVKLRDYQYEAAWSCFNATIPSLGWWPRGILQVATGGGKTEIAVAIYEMHRVPTFFLVHRKDLLLQAKERFERYGHSVGIVGAGNFTLDPDITIATMQTVNKVLNNKDDHRWRALYGAIQNTKQLFVDESHLVASTLDKGNMFTQTVDQFVDAYARWGLTATPFMRTRYDNLLLEGTTGGLLCSITNADLIERGYLTPPKVKMLKIPGKLEVKLEGKRGNNKDIAAHYRKIKNLGIRFNEPRNVALAQEIAHGAKPVLALVTTTEQGEFIQNILRTKFNRDVPLLTGKASAELRREAVEHLQDGTLPELITTPIFDEGIDIPELRTVALCSGEKSQQKLLQRLGRGVRLADGKQEVIIIDCADTHHRKLREHALERRKVYVSEGFEVREMK